MKADLQHEARRQQAVLAALRQRDAAQAQALAPWLLPLPGPRGLARAAEGLAAYRRHADALAERALAAVHPVLGRLLGQAVLADLAQRLWHEHPPRDGDMANWGAELPALLGSLPELAAMPWLLDVARLEWALHIAARAEDADDAPTGLHRLGVDDPESLGLRLRPGTQVLVSTAALWSVWRVHQQAPTAPELAALALSLREGVSEPVLVHRAGWQVVASPMTLADADFTQALAQGCSLGEALRLHPPTDFEPWLLRALREHWLRAIEPLSSPHTVPKDSP